MNNFVPNTEINPLLFTCGNTVSTSQVLTAVEVCAAEQYTFRFTNITQPGLPVIEVVRPTRVMLLDYVNNLIAGDTYNVAVRANSGGLVGDYSNECEFTLEGMSGLVVFDEANSEFTLEEESTMTVFPNPSDGSQIQVAVETSTEADQLILEVFDLQGKKLISQTITTGSALYRLELNNLSKGIYLLQARSNGTLISSEKFIVD